MIGDANSMTYVLHLGLGEDFLLPRVGETPLKLRLVATLSDSIFQGELLMSEDSFRRHFPEVDGFRFLLVDTEPSNASAAAELLEQRLADFGLDVQSTADKLAGFHRVENTYLSTFQTLGGLGLVLGTFGLAAVLLRNVLERRRELALLRAVGYRARDFSLMIVAENSLLLFLGLVTGSASAIVAIAPALLARGGNFGGGALGFLLIAVIVSGLLSSGPGRRGSEPGTPSREPPGRIGGLTLRRAERDNIKYSLLRSRFPPKLDIPEKDEDVSDPLTPELRSELQESLLEAIQDFFDDRLMPGSAEGQGVKKQRITDRQLQLATAVLLLEVARCDFDLRADEFKAVSAGLRDILGLTEDEAVAVVRFAEEEVRQSKRMHQFTTLIDTHYSPEQKKKVIQ